MYLEYLQSSLLAGSETILSRGNSSLLGTEKVHILTLMLKKEAHNIHIGTLKLHLNFQKMYTISLDLRWQI